MFDLNTLEGLRDLVILLSLLAVGQFYLVYRLSREVDALEAFKEHITNNLAAQLGNDFAAVYNEHRKLITSMWQYFYYLLATKNIIDVEPENFVATGFNDLCDHEPLFKEVLQVTDDPETQKKIFAWWEDHFKRVYRKKLQTVPASSIPPSES